MLKAAPARAAKQPIKSKMEEIKILESQIKADDRQVNGLLSLREIVTNESNDVNVRIGSIHALRRIFIHFFDSGKMCPLEKSVLASIDKDKRNKLKEFKSWLMQQYHHFEKSLLEFISGGVECFLAVSVRSLLEFVKREYIMTRNQSSDQVYFGFKTFHSLVKALLESTVDLSVDLLLLFKDEVFTKPDCFYYGCMSVRNVVCDQKSENNDNLARNALDVIRMMLVPASLAMEEFLMPNISSGSEADNGHDSEDYEDQSDDEHDSAGVDRAVTKAGSKHAGAIKGKKAVITCAMTKSSGAKRQAAAQSPEPSKRSHKMTSADHLVNLSSHKRMFSKAWLAVLSLPLTAAQHKTVLRHLPEHVVDHLDKPLLLADYLTKSYESGGVVAVLALDSLFKLIIQKNLDYPKFFQSLYCLCTVQVFSAKYRAKYMKLLSASLKSSNLPVYLVAAFIKRLAQLALHVPSPAALFCVAQITWLLRHHTQCMVLLHRKAKTSKSGLDSKKTEPFLDNYNPREEGDLTKCNALSSSLWELDALADHHCSSVALMARSLRDVSSTDQGVAAPYLRVDDYLESDYVSAVETSLSQAKTCSALAFTVPSCLIDENSMIMTCFGN